MNVTSGNVVQCLNTGSAVNDEHRIIHITDNRAFNRIGFASLCTNLNCVRITELNRQVHIGVRNDCKVVVGGNNGVDRSVATELNLISHNRAGQIFRSHIRGLVALELPTLISLSTVHHFL